MFEPVDPKLTGEPSDEFRTVLVEEIEDVEGPLLKLSAWDHQKRGLVDLAQEDLMLTLLGRQGLLAKNLDLRPDLGQRSVQRGEKGGIDLIQAGAKRIQRLLDGS